MTQHQLDRAVARRTGESARTIAARGFSLLELTPPVRATRRSSNPLPGERPGKTCLPARSARTS